MKTNKQQKMEIWKNSMFSFEESGEKEIQENEQMEEPPKNICIPQKQKREIKSKEKQKRVITKEKRWIFNQSDYEKENQKQLLNSIYECSLLLNTEIIDNNVFENAIETTFENKYTELHKRPIEKRERIVFQELHKKIYGYKRQDIEKNILCIEKFITFPFVLEKLIQSKCMCFYCYEDVQILYENVREPMQWTLDRIDNSFGHNMDNVEIACLNCNLRRRTIYYQRYLLTKQLAKIRKTGN